MRRRHLTTSIAVFLTCLWSGFLGYQHLRGEPSILDRIEGPLADLRFLLQGTRTPSGSVVLVAIDDRTAQEAGHFPLPRKRLAQLIDIIADAKPKLIALDLLLVDPGPEDGDEALANALRREPSVLAAAALFDQNSQSIVMATAESPVDLQETKSILLPEARFLEAAGVGTVNLSTDSSGVPRHIPLALRHGQTLISSLPLRAASLNLGQDPALSRDTLALGDATFRLDTGFTLPLRFYGPRRTFQTVSAADILKNGAVGNALRDKIVIVGATVVGGGDVFPTPFDPVLPGIEVLATGVSNLVEHDYLLRDRQVRWIDLVTAAALPIALIVLLAWKRSAIGFGLIVLIVLTWMIVNVAAFFQGIWLSATLPLAAAMPPAILFGGAMIWLDRRRASDLVVERGTLRLFQPPGLAERLAENPDFLRTPIRQQAALIFIDLSGFTGLSEIMTPEENRDLLKGFHALVDEEAVHAGGFVANFMGDGAMIIFGLPEASAKDAHDALTCCAQLCVRTVEWLRALPDSISDRIGFKVGAHYGAIMASRLGGDSHQHITAIGDTVNIASRLMEVAAFHNAELAISHDLMGAAGGRSAIPFGTLNGPVMAPIRGRSGSLAIFLWRSA